MADENESTADSEGVFVFLQDNEEKSIVSSIGDISLSGDNNQFREEKSLLGERREEHTPTDIMFSSSFNNITPIKKSKKNYEDELYDKDEDDTVDIYDDDRSSLSPASPTSVFDVYDELNPTSLPDLEEKEQQEEENMTLFDLVCAENWSLVLHHLSLNKEEASFWVIQENTGLSKAPPRLPLHQACASRAPKVVIKALIDAYPKGVQSSEIFGCLPLHLACQSKAPLGAVRALLRAYPKATTVAVGGLLPIHMACIGNNVSLAVVESLLRVHPESKSIRDRHGYTPLMYYELSCCPHKAWGLKMILSDHPRKEQRMTRTSSLNSYGYM